MFDHDEYRKKAKREQALKEKIEAFTKVLFSLKPGQAEKLIEGDYKEIEKMKKPNQQADKIFSEAEKWFRNAEEDKDPWLGKYNQAFYHYREAVKLYHETGNADDEIKALEKLRVCSKKQHEYELVDEIDSQIHKIRSSLGID